jgi:hypothetical protein
MVCPPAQPPPPHPGRKPWFLTGYLEDGLASPATQRGFFLSEAGKPSWATCTSIMSGASCGRKRSTLRAQIPVRIRPARYTEQPRRDAVRLPRRQRLPKSLWLAYRSMPCVGCERKEAPAGLGASSQGLVSRADWPSSLCLWENVGVTQFPTIGAAPVEVE